MNLMDIIRTYQEQHLDTVEDDSGSHDPSVSVHFVG